LQAPHAPEYPTTDSTGKSILEGGATDSTSTGGNSGSDGTATGGGSDTDPTPAPTPDPNPAPDNPPPVPDIDVKPDTNPDTDVPSLFPKPTAPASATAKCTSQAGSAGLIPCGRNSDDTNTPWNECNPCDLFSIILMGQLTIEFLLKLAAIAATLSIIFAGFLYVFAAGNTGLTDKARKMITYTLTGFAIIFISWIIVDAILSSLGYINPLGGDWYAISNTKK
jgi:hypothetical protein